jgi:hypothetical protein
MFKCLQSFSWLHADGKVKQHEAGSQFVAVDGDIAKAKRMGLVALAPVEPVEAVKESKKKKADAE